MKKYLILFLLLTSIYSCKKEDIFIDETETPELTDEVVVYNAEKLDDSYLFAIENGGTVSYLINKEGRKLYTWNFDDNLGNDLELLESGELLGLFKDSNRPFTFGGGGGTAKLFNVDGSLKWEYTIADDNFLAHHDVEMLPNGNVLFLVWERITVAQAQQVGINTNEDIFPEKLIEINPATNQVVWEWRSWDRLIQDVDQNLSTYAVVSDNPQKIDFNYNTLTNGDIMHANGFDYDLENDVIHMSINFYSEIWVIDHSTTTDEAIGDLGGNYNKGGDLIYRYGNPSAYKNPEGTRLFNNNHFPNLLEGDVQGSGNMLIYVNKYNDLEQSIVYELDLPATFSLTPNTDNEPAIIWSFTDSELFANKFSGAVRLSNGNTLICEGDYGYWEVTVDGEVVWKYKGMEGLNFWRGYNYNRNSTALSNLNI
tara:strand:+ start:29 stop:1303 length:1275 start_codon:yes stop_codon:yes gene_type:complete